MTWVASEIPTARGGQPDAPDVQTLTVDVDSSAAAVNAAMWAAAQAEQNGATLAIACDVPTADTPVVPHADAPHTDTCAQCRVEERHAMLDLIAAAVRFEHPGLAVETRQAF